MDQIQTLFHTLKPKLEAAGAFGQVTVSPQCLRCDALASAEPAFYALWAEGSELWVSLQTPARYLSQSIEADLVFTGDKIEDLIHEEMVDLGYAGPALPVQHFRSEDKLYTFRSSLPQGVRSTVDVCVQALLAYEAAFRPLGDMEADDED